MNYFQRSIFVILIAIYSLTACSGNTKQTNYDTTISNFKFENGEPLNANNWHCFNIDDERICIPSSWKAKKQSKALFLSNLDYIDSNSYYAILKYNMSASGLNTIKYLKETYTQLKKDSMEQFTGYTVKKIIFDDKESYYCEYYTSINKKPYLTYSTVLEKDNDLFEIALKVDSSKANAYKETYKEILFNFHHKNEAVFSSKDEIKNIEVIDLSKL